MLDVLLFFIYVISGALLGYLTFRIFIREENWMGSVIGGLVTLLLYPPTLFVANIYVDYLLYESMWLQQVWTQRFIYQWGLAGAGFVIATAVLLANVFLSAKLVVGKINGWYRLIIAAVSIAVGIAFATGAYNTWDEILLFFAQVPANEVDPLYGVDLSWYMFSYPFWTRMVGWGFWLLLVTILATGGVYGFQAMEATDEERNEDVAPKALVHVGVLISLLFVMWAFSWQFTRWALPLYGWTSLGYANDYINGAGWIDVNYTQYVLLAAPVLCALIAVGCVVAVMRGSFRILMYSIATKAVYWLVLLVLVPGLLYACVVRPSELEKETSYIQWGNQSSLQAYGLAADRLTRLDHPAEGLTQEVAQNAPDGIFENIRFLDPEQVFMPNLRQDEAIRNYYSFLDPDVVLYRAPDGRAVQVMSSAREICVEQIPNRTWTNEHLVYTHGQGMPMAKVHDFDRSGNMHYLVRNLPGVGPFVAENEDIYYGECTSQWTATGTSQKEVGAPLLTEGGWEPTTYEGIGGVAIGSGLRRLAFAISFNDITLLYSGQVLASSRLHYQRQIQERVMDIVPFLWLDKDPYMVVAADQPNLTWIWDAATYNDFYPYADVKSPPSDSLLGGMEFRYLRPSVKVSLDAYTGQPTFYALDSSDPVLLTWQRIFPTLFKPGSEAPAGIQDKFRYPEQVFIMQAEVLQRHHMTHPQLLYNGEDQWSLAAEQTGDRIELTAPRYIYTTLPGQEEPEYVLDWGYTRVDKPNGVGLLVARSKPDVYGQLILYKYPVGQSITGPAQFENFIDQGQIGPWMTMMNQSGKEVIRGNTLTIPVGDAILYTESIFVRATATSASGQSGLPQLKYIIVGSTEKWIGIGSNLDEAIRDYLRGGQASSDQPAGVPIPDVPGEATGNQNQPADECTALWQQLQAAVEARNSEQTGRLATEILIKQCNQ